MQNTSSPQQVSDLMLPIHSSGLSRLDSVSEALSRFQHTELPAIAICDSEGRLEGIVSNRDCLSPVWTAKYHGDPLPLVGDVMTTRVDTVSPDMTIGQVIEFMSQATHPAFPVVEYGRCVGMISRKIILKHLSVDLVEPSFA